MTTSRESRMKPVIATIDATASHTPASARPAHSRGRRIAIAPGCRTHRIPPPPSAPAPSAPAEPWPSGAGVEYAEVLRAVKLAVDRIRRDHLARSTPPIDIATVADSHDQDDEPAVMDLVDDPIVAGTDPPLTV